MGEQGACRHINGPVEPVGLTRAEGLDALRSGMPVKYKCSTCGEEFWMSKTRQALQDLPARKPEGA